MLVAMAAAGALASAPEAGKLRDVTGRPNVDGQRKEFEGDVNP